MSVFRPLAARTGRSITKLSNNSRGLAPRKVHQTRPSLHTNNWTNSACEPFFNRALELYEKAEDLPGATRCRLRLSEEWGGWLEPGRVLDQTPELAPEMAQHVLEIASRQFPRHTELAFRLGEACAAVGEDRQASHCFLRVTNLEVAKFHGLAYESAPDAYRRLKLYPEEVTRLYERAVQAYTAFAEEAAAARCHRKLRQSSRNYP